MNDTTGLKGGTDWIDGDGYLMGGTSNIGGTGG